MGFNIISPRSDWQPQPKVFPKDAGELICAKLVLSHVTDRLHKEEISFVGEPFFLQSDHVLLLTGCRLTIKKDAFKAVNYLCG